jgi:hypothetical protein
MDLSCEEIVKKIDIYLDAHPNIALPIVAEKLHMSGQAIEEALKKVEGVTFREFQSNKRLVQAFAQLGELSPAADGPYEEKRARRRFIIPKATVRYRMSGFWYRKSELSSPCPLVDISRDGLAFLGDQSVLAKKRISLIIQFPGEEALQVKGSVVYTIATGIAGFRYRIGVTFSPFDDKRGCNTLASLNVLARLEEIYT